MIVNKIIIIVRFSLCGVAKCYTLLQIYYAALKVKQFYYYAFQ